MTRFESISGVVGALAKAGRITPRQASLWQSLITHGVPASVAAILATRFGMTVERDRFYVLPA